MPKLNLKKPKFKMYQEVMLLRELVEGHMLCEPESVRIKKGQTGTVLLICRVPDIPSIGYTIEFFNKKGETIAVSTVKEEDIAALPDDNPDVKVAKQSNAKINQNHGRLSFESIKMQLRAIKISIGRGYH